MPLLTDILKELDKSDFDVHLTGFNAEELSELFREADVDTLTGDDFDVEDEIKQISESFTQYGDIWCLDKHRLMCGDSTLEDDVLKLLDGSLADMCFTDPPYNVNYESETTGKIMNDNMDNDSFFKFLTSAFSMMFLSLKQGGSFYICHADSEGLNFRKAVAEAGLALKQCLIWVKNSFVMGRQDYHWQHEPILYGWKEGSSHYFTFDRTQSTVVEEVKAKDIKKLKKSEMIDLLNSLLSEKNINTTTIRENKPQRNPEHPTMKPIPLCARCIQNSCRYGEKVIDLFGGSGSTLIACEQIGRIAYLMELDTKFCDVIVRRYIKTFGKDRNIYLIRNGKKTEFNKLEI